MRKVILDTNFLLIPYQFKIDIFSEIDLIIHEKYALCAPEAVIGELKKLSESKGKDGKAAKLALALMAKKNVNIIKDSKRTEYGDKAILDIADKNTLVATQDIELRKRLKLKGIRAIIMWQKRHLRIV